MVSGLASLQVAYFFGRGDRFCVRGVEFMMPLAWLLLLKSILEKQVSSNRNHW